MSSTELRCLESFPGWLGSLGTDANALAELLGSSDSSDLRDAAARSLIYLTKSLDLIPDGLEELGYMDDVFVLRVAAARVPEAARSGDTGAVVARLAADTELIRAFLEDDDYRRLEIYVEALADTAARGRTVEEVLNDAEIRASLISDVRTWAGSYRPPTFAPDEKSLIKLRSFMKTRLA